MGNLCCRPSADVDIFTRRYDNWNKSAATTQVPTGSGLKNANTYADRLYKPARAHEPAVQAPLVEASKTQHADSAAKSATPAAATASPQVPSDSANTQQQQVSEEDAIHQPPTNWYKGELLGEGAFGKVYSCLDVESGQLLAVKVVPLNQRESNRKQVDEYVKSVSAEVEQLSRLKHENIVQYRGTCVTEGSLNIFLEYVPGGSISSLLEKFGAFSESVIKIYVKQILQGLEYIHSKGVLHRDIKGANLLVDKKGTVKLADFGASKNIENLATIGSGAAQSFKGTPFWMAPEVIKQTGHGRPADIWSVGCTMLEMATGKPPWSEFAQSPVSVMFHIASSKDPPPLPACLSPDAKSFLQLCFNRVPRERATATALLQHPFLQKSQALAFAAPGMIASTPPNQPASAPQHPQRPPTISTKTPPPSPPRADQDSFVLQGSPRTPMGAPSEASTSHAWPAYDSARYSPLTASKMTGGTPYSTAGSIANSPQLRPRHNLPATPAHSSNLPVEEPNIHTPTQPMQKMHRMSLSFNPVQEPSWAPSPERDVLLAQIQQQHSNNKTPGSKLHSFGLASSINSDCATSMFNPRAQHPDGDDEVISDQNFTPTPKPREERGKLDTDYSVAYSSNQSLNGLPSPQGWSLRGRNSSKGKNPATTPVSHRVETSGSMGA